MESESSRQTELAVLGVILPSLLAKNWFPVGFASELLQKGISSGSVAMLASVQRLEYRPVAVSMGVASTSACIPCILPGQYGMLSSNSSTVLTELAAPMNLNACNNIP